MRPHTGENATSLLFTSNNVLADRLKASPHYPREGQPIAYSNEGVVC